jgi:tetratricopeptide (TPR) repeat protein
MTRDRVPLVLATTTGAVIATIVAMFTCRVSKPSAHSAITTSEVRYRFGGLATKNVRQDLDDAIAAAVARSAHGHDDPLEMTELANLYFARAELDGDRRDFDAAEQLARQSLTLLPAPNGASITLAKLANARHDFHEAIDLAHHYQGRNAVAVPMVLATAYLALGDLTQAGAAADEAVQSKPTPSTYLERALVLQAQGRDVEAEADFANAVRVEDYGDVLESARVRALWSRFLVRRGDNAGAKLVIDEALRIAPGNALALSIRGELELRTGNPKSARADLEQAFLAQHQVRYLIDQARAMEVGGDRAGANTFRAHIDTIVRDEQSQGGVGHRLELVEVLVDRREPAGFAEAVQIARVELARRPAAETRFQRARAHARTGNRDEADFQIQAALASGAHEPQYYELASRLEREGGNAARTALYAGLADSLDPARDGWRNIGMPP